jgi:hypothetical protein
MIGKTPLDESRRAGTGPPLPGCGVAPSGAGSRGIGMDGSQPIHGGSSVAAWPDRMADVGQEKRTAPATSRMTGRCRKVGTALHERRFAVLGVASDTAAAPVVSGVDRVLVDAPGGFGVRGGAVLVGGLIYRSGER